MEFALYQLRDFFKRCKFGFCNLWLEAEYQDDPFYSSTWYEPILTFLIPGVFIISLNFFAITYFYTTDFIKQSPNSYQLLIMNTSSMVLAGFIYYCLGILNVVSASLMQGDFYLLVKNLSSFMFEGQALALLRTSLMLNAFIIAPILLVLQITAINQEEI
jgi:hypothetical protein